MLIGIFVISYLEGVFMQVIWWVLEISLVIFCLGVVSVVIMLQIISVVMCNVLYVCFGLFVVFVFDSLCGVGGCECFESSNVVFVVQVVGLEMMCVVSVFEDLYMCLCNGWLICLSSEFMVMNICFYVFY